MIYCKSMPNSHLLWRTDTVTCLAYTTADELIDFIKSNKRITFCAPTLIIVSGFKGPYSPLTDCSAVIQNIFLATDSHGVRIDIPDLGFLSMPIILHNTDSFQVSTAKE